MSEAFEKNLASYSLKSSNTIGRKYKENPPKRTTEFQSLSSDFSIKLVRNSSLLEFFSL